MKPDSRTLVVVSGDWRHEDLLDALLGGSGDFDVVMVATMADGYTRVKQMLPDLVVVLPEGDDWSACQLLSMLAADENTCQIPVETSVFQPPTVDADALVAAASHRRSRRPIPVQMN